MIRRSQKRSGIKRDIPLLSSFRPAGPLAGGQAKVVVDAERDERCGDDRGDLLHQVVGSAAGGIVSVPNPI